MITLRFVGGNDAFSRGISDAEYGFWAIHAEALMPDGTLLGAHIEGGVQARPHDYDKGQFSKELYVSIPASAEMTDKFYSFLRAQLGKPYDTEAIAAFVAGAVVGERNWQEPDSWFCSELQAAALVHCGWFASELATEVNHITPRDLLLIVSGRVPISGATA